jgi:hypothetical protein
MDRALIAGDPVTFGWCNYTCARCYFRYRGLLVDTARHYLPLSVLRQQIDALAWSKMNVLHWYAFLFHSIFFILCSFVKLPIDTHSNVHSKQFLTCLRYLAYRPYVLHRHVYDSGSFSLKSSSIPALAKAAAAPGWQYSYEDVTGIVSVSHVCFDSSHKPSFYQLSSPQPPAITTHIYHVPPCMESHLQHYHDRHFLHSTPATARSESYSRWTRQGTRCHCIRCAIGA